MFVFSHRMQGEKNIFVKMSKIKNYLLQKGYENDLVYAVMKQIM